MSSEAEDVIELSTSETPNETEGEEPELKQYLVFREQKNWSMFEGTHIGIHETGSLLVFNGKELTDIAGPGYISAMEKSRISQSCLYDWGIEKRPPPKPPVVELIQTHKVMLDEIETTSEGWRAVVYDSSRCPGCDKNLGEYDSFEDAVYAVWAYKTKGSVEQVVNVPKVSKDPDGWLSVDERPIDVKMIQVWMKYSDNEVEEGWLHEGDFLTKGWLFGFFRFRAPKPVVRWKLRGK